MIDFGRGSRDRPKPYAWTMTAPATPETRVSRWSRSVLPPEFLEATLRQRSTRDWVVDTVFFLVAVAVGLATLYESWPDHSTFLAVVDIALGTVACLAMWLRRSQPVPVAGFALAASLVSGLAGGAAPLAVFNVALRGSLRALPVIFLLSGGSVVMFPLVYPSIGDFWPQVIYGALVMIVAIGWGLFTRARRELITSLQTRAEQLEAEQRLRITQSREAERRRIAREMHDVLAHRISLLSVHAGALEFRRDASNEEVAEAAGVIRANAQSALEELREVIGVLREDIDESIPQPPQPTMGLIPTLIEESRAAGMNIRFIDDVTRGDSIPDALGRTAYRIVQEGLTNARKHASAAAVDVTLVAGPPLVVEILSRRVVGVARNDQLQGTGTGLIGLAERVALAGGELQHGPDDNGDFVLRAKLPWTN
jgi:signal transduction histidine kinase